MSSSTLADIEHMFAAALGTVIQCKLCLDETEATREQRSAFASGASIQTFPDRKCAASPGNCVWELVAPYAAEFYPTLGKNPHVITGRIRGTFNITARRKR